MMMIESNPSTIWGNKKTNDNKQFKTVNIYINSHLKEKNFHGDIIKYLVELYLHC